MYIKVFGVYGGFLGAGEGIEVAGVDRKDSIPHRPQDSQSLLKLSNGEGRLA